jgi:hypothetical protein
MSKGRSADLSGEISGKGLEKAPGPPRGRPFTKGESGNPGGRPKVGGAAEFRQLARQAAATFLDALVAKAEAQQLSFEQLTAALDNAATRGGCLTDERQAEIDGKRLHALGEILAGLHLTAEHRTQILADYQAQLKALNEAT